MTAPIIAIDLGPDLTALWSGGFSPIAAPAITARPTLKRQPCPASDRVSHWCAVCHRLIAGPVHIDSETLKLTCSNCCAICACKKGGR